MKDIEAKRMFLVLVLGTIAFTVVILSTSCQSIRCPYHETQKLSCSKVDPPRIDVASTSQSGLTVSR